MPPLHSYRRLQQYAIAISIASVLYNGAEGGISIGFAAESSSRSLFFFGLQSGIEVLSAIVVVWRFKKVAKPGEEKEVSLDAKELRIERYCSIAISCLLLLLGLATEITAIVSLVLHSEPDTSLSSLIISASALVLMVLIWLPKRYLAKALNSSVMQGEAKCSLSCIQFTLVLFVGSLIFRLWKGGWWVDSATTLFLGILFGWEGWKMLRWAMSPEFDGGCCSDCKNEDAEEQELKYRDICECCMEKSECREADECKCSGDDTSCCTPVKADGGEKCCSREMLSQPRSDSADAASSPQNSKSCDDKAGCCAPVTAGKKDCCSGNTVQERSQACSDERNARATEVQMKSCEAPDCCSD